jgi:hypothetical protein
VIAEPLSKAPRHETVIFVSPATTDGMSGAEGAPAGTTDPDIADGWDNPSPFLASTLNV